MGVQEELFCPKCVERFAAVEGGHEAFDYGVRELDADLGEVGSREKEKTGE